MKEPKAEVYRLHSCFDCLNFKCIIHEGKLERKLTGEEIDIVFQCNIRRIGNHFIQQQKLYEERKEMEKIRRRLCAKRWLMLHPKSKIKLGEKR